MNFARTWFAVLALVCNAFIWGVSWWPLRYFHESGLHPLWATVWMFVAVVLVVGMYAPRVCRDVARTPALWALALASGLTNVSFNWAVTTGDVVRVVLLFYLMPAWALLLARWLLREPITGQGLMRLSLAIVGVLLVLKRPQDEWPIPSSLADWLALAGGFTFALTNILLRKLKQSTASSRLMAMFVGGAVLAAVMAQAMQPAQALTFPLQAPGYLILAVLALGLFFLLGNLALQYGAARLPPATTSLVMLTEIIFASVSAAWLGAASLELRVLWGGLLILTAAVWSALG